jgi:hypothetical protein
MRPLDNILISVYIWMRMRDSNRPMLVFAIPALGIHLFSGGYPPMSHRVYALNSFVLPAHEVDVVHAPLLGLCPYGNYSF